MSFGRPPSFMTFSAAPPDRGSFPLDHEGECSAFMKEYLNCLKENQNNNGMCRHLSKKYLNCRMEKGLMGTDSFKNLGFQDDDEDDEDDNKGANARATSSTPQQSSKGATTATTTTTGR
ncbi:hypothetical protein BC939DRAFT_446191 [Gamsiella multidivaricata]|uniref:uncharacterized protein n=1 Tax=Gamsiella multidivaricata TaxID=101098 RepID=UPI00221F81FC|nr:uncharacterized protein BC939DRAFT_446191 [Gamsiella multidivaricata]KAI7826914.1 hypothetical protein BC939DRAFT_446191 [Gamsiella multidivaricata]